MIRLDYCIDHDLEYLSYAYNTKNIYSKRVQCTINRVEEMFRIAKCQYKMDSAKIEILKNSITTLQKEAIRINNIKNEIDDKIIKKKRSLVFYMTNTYNKFDDKIIDLQESIFNLSKEFNNVTRLHIKLLTKIKNIKNKLEMLYNHNIRNTKFINTVTVTMNFVDKIKIMLDEEPNTKRRRTDGDVDIFLDKLKLICSK